MAFAASAKRTCRNPFLNEISFFLMRTDEIENAVHLGVLDCNGYVLLYLLHHWTQCGTMEGRWYWPYSSQVFHGKQEKKTASGI